ncbi:MAG TPA: LL-diaminopimelate aminotransferase [bacterium]|nr:LL-diaminopimelate aminotransferase [bacterium]
MTIRLADRIKNLPPYLFAEIDRLKAEQLKKGIDIIDLGIGDPDQPTPRHIIEALQKAAGDAANHQYPSYSGMLRFRQAAASWMKGRFGVSLEAESEVVSLIGSKEGIANFPLAFVNPGDVVLVPSPGYPPYNTGTLFAGGQPYFLPLKRENKFLPDLDSIPADVLKRAKVLHVNYPNNPTGAIAGREFFEKVVAFAKKNDVIICSDAAYCEQYEGERPLSFLEIEGAREVGIEFHSLSKTYNMTGWRIGFACGNREIIAGLGKVKTNIDSGIFQAVQWAGVAALEGDQGCVEEMRKIYRNRRRTLVEGLKKIGWDVASSAAAFYVWVAVPKGYDSKKLAMKVLEESGIVITPGVGFGEGGEGYVRFALTREEKRLQEALDRLAKLKL